MTCTTCNSKKTTNVISWALPMNLCLECGNLWGVFSGFYARILYPIETFFTGSDSVAFMGYECGYFKALWYWITTPPGDLDE